MLTFLITSGEVFDKKTILYENWVQGTKYVVNDITAKDIRGNYDLKIDNETYKWVVKGEITAPTSEIKAIDSTKVNSKLTIANNWVSLILKSKDSTKNKFNRLTAYLDTTTNLSGKAISFDGKESTWSAIKTGPFVVEKEEDKVEKNNLVLPSHCIQTLHLEILQKPTQQTLLFKNATVWTNEKEGILQANRCIS